jgi:hypothetical protein
MNEDHRPISRMQIHAEGRPQGYGLFPQDGQFFSKSGVLGLKRVVAGSSEPSAARGYTRMIGTLDPFFTAELAGHRGFDLAG